jgi:hypothetical protein
MTPAKPKAVKAKVAKPSKAAKPSKTTQPANPNPKTPTAPVSLFAARQIEASRNKQSATLLFTPHKIRGAQIRFSHELQPSPTQQPAPQNVSSQLGSVDSDSDIEEGLVEELERLDFHADSTLDSDSDSQKSTGPQLVSKSVPSSHSRSRAKSPRAGPHSKPQPCKPRGGAQDVWTFFTKGKGKRECILCQ